MAPHALLSAATSRRVTPHGSPVAQWLSFDQPDPRGEQYQCIVDAVEAMQVKSDWADAAEVYLWVDVCCIPQQNDSIKSIAIGSLVAYVSLCRCGGYGKCHGVVHVVVHGVVHGMHGSTGAQRSLGVGAAARGNYGHSVSIAWP